MAPPSALLDEDVVAGATVEHVLARAAVQNVIPRAAQQRVVAGAADDDIGAVAAVRVELDGVGRQAGAGDRVIARESVD